MLPYRGIWHATGRFRIPALACVPAPLWRGKGPQMARRASAAAGEPHRRAPAASRSPLPGRPLGRIPAQAFQAIVQVCLLRRPPLLQRRDDRAAMAAVGVVAGSAGAENRCCADPMAGFSKSSQRIDEGQSGARGVTRSPRPSQSARPPLQKNGTSEPSIPPVPPSRQGYRSCHMLLQSE